MLFLDVDRFEVTDTLLLESEVNAKICIERNGVIVHRGTKIINKFIDGKSRISTSIKRIDGL